MLPPSNKSNTSTALLKHIFLPFSFNCIFSHIRSLSETKERKIYVIRHNMLLREYVKTTLHSVVLFYRMHKAAHLTFYRFCCTMLGILYFFFFGSQNQIKFCVSYAVTIFPSAMFVSCQQRRILCR